MESNVETNIETNVEAQAPPKEGRFDRQKYKERSREVLAFLRHYAPYALLLLLAPQIDPNIVFRSGGQALFQLPYWLILAAVALPLGLLCLHLRPMGDRPVFRFAALLLPIQFYFMLRFSSRTSPLVALGLVALCALFAVICRFWILIDCTRNPKGDLLSEENVVEAKLSKTHRRRVLCYTVPFASAVLLVFSIMGAMPERSYADPGLFTAQEAFLPAESPAGRLQLLCPAHWGGLTQRERREVLQLLLNAETRALNISPIRLDDEAVFALQSSSTLSIQRALRSGRNQPEARIRAVSYAAYYHRLAQNSAIDPADFDARAAAHAERRVAHYMALISGEQETESGEGDD